MRTFKITLEYDGGSFCGWQKQKRTQPTLQSSLERCLRAILHEKVVVVASGRTDAGVNALEQVVHCTTSSRIPAANLARALNSILPGEMAIRRVEEVSSRFHAQRSVKAKQYRYTILNEPYRCAFLRGRALWYPFRLNVPAMKQAARYLTGRHDFKAFCGAASTARTTVRTIRRISIRRTTGTVFPCASADNRRAFITIDVEGEGFLYTMVRTIAGTLIEVGRGRFSPRQAKTILASRDRTQSGPTAPAAGLCLMHVTY